MTSSRWGMPGRFAAVVWAAGIFIALSFATRIVLIVFESYLGGPPRGIPAILAVGALYDVAAATFVVAPFAFVALLFPNTPRGRFFNGIFAAIMTGELLFGVLFMAVAEVLFWNEFASRFNFIAVDYLIYTRETIGNIKQSYPVPALMAGIVVGAAVLFLAAMRPIWRAATADGGTLRQRAGATGAFLVLPVLSFIAIGDAPRDHFASNISRELALNGGYEFCRAFRSNDLDFHTFYSTIDPAKANDEMRHEFVEAQSASVFTNVSTNPIERWVQGAGPRLPLNVVLVTMESFGAELTESLGGEKGLSPNLDRLGRDGLAFTQMYATGTRTVRGLEAVSASIPPTPGQAIVKRPHNKGLQTLGGVFKSFGYDAIFLYGGYSYFDNMSDFFGGNGYEVVDRTAVEKKDISHETIWGIADEDLFNLVIKQFDLRTASGKPVFAQVMTTSNHRPFTYPSGRIAIPSGSGRSGAAAYSDWAIGDFIKKASARPWFKDTVFVFVADHTSIGRGRADLPMENYHIPMIIYSPAHVKPAVVDAIASQIDVGPTILALLNASYKSSFFGQDILTEGQHHARALMSNYLTVGHVESGVLVEMSPKRTNRIIDVTTGKVVSPDDPRGAAALTETIAHFQVTADLLKAQKP